MFRAQLKNKLGDWSALNWARDKIIGGFVYVERNITSAIGSLMDTMSGTQVKKQVQKALDDMSNTVNKNVVDVVNKDTQKLANSIVSNANTTISDVQNHVNSMITNLNTQLSNIVSNVNTAVNKTNTNLASFRSSIQSALQQAVDEIIDTYNENITDKWNKQMNEIQNKLIKLISDINNTIGQVDTGIEEGVNYSISELEKNVENMVNITFAQIWSLLGLQQGVVFQPVIVKDVKTETFSLYSTGKGTTMYYIAIGR